MLKKTLRILEYSRIFSLPMTFFSWLIIFVFCYATSGNRWYGILSLLGLFFVHLAVNLLDDYFDYKFLIKKVNFDKEAYLKNSQKTKCRYLINGQLSEKKLLGVVSIYLFAAFLTGLYLFAKCGIGVLYFALAGIIAGVLYPFLSRICLSELAVAVAYGPALFGGVYYVMTGTYNWEVFLLSLPSMFMTVVLLYIHTVMDYEFDINEGKITLAGLFDSQLDALAVLKALLILAYISVIPMCIFDITDWQIFLTYLTIPLSVDLYNSLKIFSCDSEELPPRKWYHFPMENMEKLKSRGEDSFMIRMYQARNLMMYFSLLLVFGIILSLAL